MANGGDEGAGITIVVIIIIVLALIQCSKNKTLVHENTVLREQIKESTR